MPRLALLLSTLVWGATFPATKAALEQIPPFSFLLLRFLIGLCATLAIFRLLGWPVQRDRALLRNSAIATGFLFLGYATQTAGLQYTTASNSAFITALYVVFVPLFARRFGPRDWVSAGLALAGLWLLVNPSLTMNVGDALSLVCAAAFAGHMVCLEAYTRRGDARSLFVWQLAFVTPMMAPAMVLEAPDAAQFAPTVALLLGLGVTGLLATGAFAVQVWAQQRLPAQKVALIYALEPAYAAWLSWYFLGERLDPIAWVGSGLILIAVLLGALKSGAVEARPPMAATSVS